MYTRKSKGVRLKYKKVFLLSRTACATVHHPDPDLGSNSPSRSSFQPDNQTGSPYPSDEKRPHDEVNLTMFLYLTLVGGVRVRLSEGRAYIIQQICLIKKAFFPHLCSVACRWGGTLRRRYSLDLNKTEEILLSDKIHWYHRTFLPLCFISSMYF